jgi:hypothetical protein
MEQAPDHCRDMPLAHISARADLDAWALPVGVARAAERIEGERPALLAQLARLAASRSR